MTTDQLEARKSLNKKILKFGCFPVVAFFFLIGIIGSFSDDTVSEKEEISENEETVNSSGITYYKILDNADQFKAGFNKFMKEVDSPLRINELQIQDGEVNNMFQYMLNDHVGLIGSLNKNDNSIRGIMMVAQGDGTLKSGFNIFIVATGIIAATNPGLAPTERGSILKDLGLLEKNADVNNLSGNTIRNNIKYYISSNELIGITLGAQHASE